MWSLSVLLQRVILELACLHATDCWKATGRIIFQGKIRKFHVKQGNPRNTRFFLFILIFLLNCCLTFLTVFACYFGPRAV